MRILSNITIGGLCFMVLNTVHADFPINDTTKLNAVAVKSIFQGKKRSCGINNN